MHTNSGSGYKQSRDWSLLCSRNCRNWCSLSVCQSLWSIANLACFSVFCCVCKLAKTEERGLQQNHKAQMQRVCKNTDLAVALDGCRARLQESDSRHSQALRSCSEAQSRWLACLSSFAEQGEAHCRRSCSAHNQIILLWLQAL